MLFPVSITIDGYLQADSYEEAQELVSRLEIRELKLQDENEPDDPFGIELEQMEMADISVLPEKE